MFAVITSLFVIIAVIRVAPRWSTPYPFKIALLCSMMVAWTIIVIQFAEWSSHG